MKYLVYSEVVINASKEEVWQQLTSLTNYQLWNPFIVHAKGEIKERNKLFIAQNMNGKIIDFQPLVQFVQPMKKFNWIRKVLYSWLFKATHEFVLIELNQNQVNLIHQERFSGLLAPIIVPKIKDSTKNGFMKMNSALREVCENKNRIENE